MIEDILKIESLSKSFVKNRQKINGKDDERYYIIDNLSFEIPKDSITALIGGNGAGKTTLFNLISGFMRPDAGEILYYGKDNGKPENLEWEKPHKITMKGIGRMFQDTHIFPEMTVLENMLIADKRKYGEQPFISLFKSKKSQRIEKERIDAAKSIFCELFGEDNTLWNKRNEAAGTLSYGQQRLLGLARIFMGNYKLVLLDEPTSGINPQLIVKILEIIRKMVKEKNMTVLLIEHNMKVVLDIADFCSFMSHGKITAFGTPDDVLGNDAVRKDYLGI